MTNYNLEYSHIYIDEIFGQEHLQGIEILNAMIKELKDLNKSYNLISMVDDYSPRTEDKFDYDAFLNQLINAGAEPDVIIRESALLRANITLLGQMKDSKLRRNLVSYLKKKEMHPCSLFVATFYAIRLGLLSSEISCVHINNDFAPSESIINILPMRFKASEKNAIKILTKIYGNDIKKSIQTIYFEEGNDTKELIKQISWSKKIGTDSTLTLT
tara:strand:+ start:1508 stop:2152 length:645 start_codon:yes stop_codon:yes gene_type:complete